MHAVITGNEPGLLPLKLVHCPGLGFSRVLSSGANDSWSTGSHCALEHSGSRAVFLGNLLQDFHVLVPAQGGP